MKVRKFHQSQMSSALFECDETQVGRDCQIPKEDNEIVKVTVDWEDGGDQIVIDRPPNPRVRVHPAHRHEEFIQELNTSEGEFDLYEHRDEAEIRIRPVMDYSMMRVYPARYE